MRLTVLLFLMAYLIASCEWSPERDNPFDPNAPAFTAPPPVNHAPQIDTIYVTSHCYNRRPSTYCAFELVCRISDADGNLGADPQFPVYYVVDASQQIMDSLGVMYSDPVRHAWVFSGNQNSIPSGLPSWTFQVKVIDDSGATAIRQTVLSQGNPSYPTLGFPGTYLWPPDEIRDTIPRFSWVYTDTSGRDRFDIAIYFQDLFKVWDTTGIFKADTAIKVDGVIEDASSHSERYYSWYLTEWDTEGNSSTSLPGLFRFFPPDPIVQPLRKEEYDY